ncbi:hypothetical protein [uncultured Finegoldia sp.]|uniref:hypothetical protein n=1 Tax=uncultured Finegoldia sp. TaxID=328009 RepID=UPI00260D137A|nr:hypothetical protein [uncultured Finegoldia sp.]
MENSTFLASDYEKNQIDAIKKLLRVYYSADIEFSKKFTSIKPDIDDENLIKIIKKLDENITRDFLIKYANEINMMAYNEENKLCFMYDANRKFTQMRKIALTNYPKGKLYGFCVEKWIQKCEKINSTSASDTQNAILNTMLDICCEKKNIMVVRISQDDFDWTDDKAMQMMDEIVSNIRKGDFC